MTAQIVRRLYMYAAAFLGLQILAAGTRGIITVLLEQPFLAPAIERPEQEIVRLSLYAALVIIGLPLWAGHWWWAQRSVLHPEEHHAAIRRLYGYAVLLVAMIGLLFGLTTLLGAIMGALSPEPVASRVARAIGTVLVNSVVWLYHWRVFSADREQVESGGAPATLRRWYLVLILAVSLIATAFAAVDVMHRLLQQALTPAIGDVDIRSSLALLLAGLLIWLPHHLWSQLLVRRTSPIRSDEARSTLRQVYLALVITITAIAALGGMAMLLYAMLLALFGGSTWRSIVIDHTQALATVVIAGALWWYHRHQLLGEARLSTVAARIDTAERVIGYLTAAVGLGALFFGLGGLLSTLLRWLLAPDVLGTGWRDLLSLYLALSIVAVPVYGLTARSMEQRAQRSLVEQRTLARRVYLYVALLFGIIVTIVATVALLRVLIETFLGAPPPTALADGARWLGYTLIGSVIAVYSTLLLRRITTPRADEGAQCAIMIVAPDPLQHHLHTAITRVFPAATLHVAPPDPPTDITAGLDTIDVLITSLDAAIDGPYVPLIRAFRGRRLLLVQEVPNYEIIGVQHDEALVRATIRALRTDVNITPLAQPPSAPSVSQGVV